MTTSIGDNGGNPTRIYCADARNAGYGRIWIQNPADSALDLHVHQAAPGESTSGSQANVPVLAPGDDIILSTARDPWVDSEGNALSSVNYTFLLDVV